MLLVCETLYCMMIVLIPSGQVHGDTYTLKIMNLVDDYV
jgi:hypothetical protein